MQPQQNPNQKQFPNYNQQPYQDTNKTHNDHRMSNQQQSPVGNHNNRNSYQGRPSNESYLSFGRMSIEEPFFTQNQKISLQSNISGKAQQIFQQKDLFQNLADCERNPFHQDLFIRDQGSYKEYQIQQKQTLNQVHQVHYPIFTGNSSQNFGFNLQPHNHFSSPNTLNIASQQFKQRSSQGNNNPPHYSGLHHTPHNQSESMIKTKLFDNQYNHGSQSGKVGSTKIQQPPTQVIQKEPEEKVISCKCPRSKCLLMYCECFSKGIMCNPTCSCYQCRNNPDFEEKRQNARRIVLQRDPNAFSNKLQVVGGEQSSQLAYKRGCNCKKTNCFKKYCQCFYAGVKCTYLCKCQNCMNGGQNAYKG